MKCISAVGFIFHIFVEVFFLLGSLSLIYNEKKNQALACIAFGAVWHCIVALLPQPSVCRGKVCGERLASEYSAGTYLSDIFSAVTILSVIIAVIFDIERDIPIMTYVIVLIADIMPGGSKNKNSKFYQENQKREFLIDDQENQISALNTEEEEVLNLKQPV